jgi:membrane protein YdbS with pleckstrin-like domain
MRFLFHNDKSTIKDELFLLLFIVICIGAGVLCYIFAPNGWIISNSTIRVFGIVWIIAGVMFIPGFIYRLCTNDTKTKKK